MSNMGSSQNLKGNSLKNNKKRLNQDQVRLLEAHFTSNKKLEPERKLQLAQQLGVPPRQIAIWYQNKRARWKNQSLELDYSSLQLRLETALDEKRQLEIDVAHLQGELQRTRETLLAYTQAHDQQLPPFSSFSSCGDDGGGSSLSLQEDVGCSWQNGGGHGLQLEELYAWLMGSEGSTRASIGQHGKAFFV